MLILFGTVLAIGELVTVNLAQVAIGAFVTLLIGPSIRSYLRTINYGDSEQPFEELSNE